MRITEAKDDMSVDTKDTLADQAFKSATPFYVTSLNNPTKHSSDSRIIQFPTPEGLMALPHYTVDEIDTHNKNGQIKQFIFALCQKYPNKKLVFKILDDSYDEKETWVIRDGVITNALKIRPEDLPDNVTIELYHHVAPFQNGIDFKGMVKGRFLRMSFITDYIKDRIICARK